jgi:DNA helicase-2/ATP-dependent DNA helicase PcrA
MPDPDDPSENQNPRLLEESLAPWPLEPHARRRTVQDVVAALVSARTAGSPARPPGRGAWDETVRLLLAERAERRRAPVVPRVPDHLSTSAVVELADAPDAFRARLRRPVPRPPAPHARLGTAFHAWVEQHYAAAALVDVHEVLGSGPEDDPAEDLVVLQQHFLASEWAGRSPSAVEVGVETTVGGRAVRGRIDAVFEDDDGGLTIVDWKTGRPGGPEQQRVRSLQLAVYRLAYARLTGRRPEQVRAAFFFAATGETVRPPLPDEAELEQLVAELVADQVEDATDGPA